MSTGFPSMVVSSFDRRCRLSDFARRLCQAKMERCRRTRVGRAARPRGRSCRAIGLETPLPSSLFVGCCTPPDFATASPTALNRPCGGRRTLCSRSGGSRSSSTAATGIRALSMGPAPSRTRPTGPRSSRKMLRATPKPQIDSATPDGSSSGSGSIRIRARSLQPSLPRSFLTPSQVPGRGHLRQRMNRSREPCDGLPDRANPHCGGAAT